MQNTQMRCGALAGFVFPLSASSVQQPTLLVAASIRRAGRIRRIPLRTDIDDATNIRLRQRPASPPCAPGGGLCVNTIWVTGVAGIPPRVERGCGVDACCVPLVALSSNGFLAHVHDCTIRPIAESVLDEY